ncbi:ABC transporter ATP-binding protein [Staphylococcus succinus]|uniref:ABC transporter ATP-binding protein n=1 Tax=Staphylococcus succinus TaxID=61015 RepID=UPI000E6886E0|nr:ABC transporter ATP-binding protein [Staphylococcus succinus]RIN36945.1 ABC transporter ATP-binding protein [Staphylococcus succinus]
MITVNSLYKEYDNAIVLNNINIRLKKGEITGLVGPNGSGKTTLMKVISNLILNYRGTVSLEDNSKIGILIENPKFFPNKTGYYNLKYFSELYNKKPENFEEIITILEMGDYLDKKVYKYSLGMKQRLGILLALLKNPDYLLLDEPTNGMDPSGIKEILMFLEKLVKEKRIGILISSHILEDVENITDNVYLMKDGNIKGEYRNTKTSNIYQFKFEKMDLQYAKKIIEKYGKIKIYDSYINIQGEYNIKKLLKNLSENELYPLDVQKKKNNLATFYFDNIEENK